MQHGCAGEGSSARATREHEGTCLGPVARARVALPLSCGFVGTTEGRGTGGRHHSRTHPASALTEATVRVPTPPGAIGWLLGALEFREPAFQNECALLPST